MPLVYRAEISVAGGPYEPTGDWTEDKQQAVQDLKSAVAQWSYVRTDGYVNEARIPEDIDEEESIDA